MSWIASHFQLAILGEVSVGNDFTVTLFDTAHGRLPNWLVVRIQRNNCDNGPDLATFPAPVRNCKLPEIRLNLMDLLVWQPLSVTAPQSVRISHPNTAKYCDRKHQTDLTRGAVPSKVRSSELFAIPLARE